MVDSGAGQRDIVVDHKVLRVLSGIDVDDITDRVGQGVGDSCVLAWHSTIHIRRSQDGAGQ